MTITDPRALDLGPYHPKIESVRSVPKTILYITKDDKNPLAYPIEWNWPEQVEASRNHKSLRLLEVANLLKNGATLETVNEDYPDILMVRLAQIETYLSWLTQTRMVQDLNPWVPPILGANPQANQIAAWMNSSIRMARGERDPHLWIWGPPMVGKTFLCYQLSKMLDTYWFPLGENFHNFFNNDKDLIVMDEYAGNLPLQQMNCWCQGYTFIIRTKGGQKMKTRNIPIIITSNSPPEEFHQEQRIKHPAIFDAYLSRFKVVHVTSRISLWNN